MSNFFDNMVARTLDLTPVVQPRLQSRFEPVGAATPVAPDQAVEVETPQPSAPQMTARPEPRVVERERVERVEFERVINTVRNTHVQTHEVKQVSAPPVVEKVREREIERLPVIEPRIHTEKTDSRIEIRENPIPLRHAEEIEKNPSNPRLITVEPAPVRKEAPVPTPQPVVPRVVTRVEPAPIVQGPRLEVPPVFQPEPTETINVTIGRVDVRAVFSAQAPKTPVRTASSSSLDDYLKQRSEGRR